MYLKDEVVFFENSSTLEEKDNKKKTFTRMNLTPPHIIILNTIGEARGMFDLNCKYMFLHILTTRDIHTRSAELCLAAWF